MIPMKSILKLGAVYLASLVVIGLVVWACIVLFAQKTLYLDQKQWNPAQPETQHIDPGRLARALDYVDTRLPTARSLLMLRNGKTVVEKYYWQSGPLETDYLHALNLPLLQVLIGIAIDQKLIQGPEQPLTAFFPKQLKQSQSDEGLSLTLNDLLWARAPLLWGSHNPDYWKLFYANDRIEASLRVVSRHREKAQPAINFAAAFLLSQVIENVSGRSVFDYAAQYLFQPLGIVTNGANEDDLPKDTFVGFQLKALDLAKMGYLLAQEGTWEGRQIVSRQWVQRLFAGAPEAELDDMPGGGWVKTIINERDCLVVRGEGGQYLVLVPATQVVLAVTSTSRFPLPKDTGRDRLLALIVGAVMEPSETETPAARPETETLATKPEPESETVSADNAYIFEPNYVLSVAVPKDILNFFDQFALDIISKDTHVIIENYARAYNHHRDMFASPSRLMFTGSPPPLEYIHITKLRIEKNRAYLRGKLKIAHRTYAGPQGVYPLENLIKLKGRWRWLGLPEKADLLDRDDYFDAELSDEQHQFLEDCAGNLMGKTSIFGKDCFAESFRPDGSGKSLFANRIQPFFRGGSDKKLHITSVQRNSDAYRVQGYIDGSALGEISLPDNLQIVKENGRYKWGLTPKHNGKTMHRAEAQRRREDQKPDLGRYRAKNKPSKDL